MPPLAPEFVELLRCPRDGTPLAFGDGSQGSLLCQDGDRYAVGAGIPDFAGDGRRGEAPFRSERLEWLAEAELWHFWFAGRAALVEELLGLVLPRPGVVLDVGCGNGALLGALARAGHRAIGVDPVAEGLERARERAPSAWLARARAERLPLADGSVDGAVLLDVLEHVEDATVLREVVRVLRRGGALVASVPAVPWLWSYRDQDSGHLRRYTRTSLRRLLADAGFRIERLRAYQSLLFPLVAASRLLGRRGPALRDLEDRPSPRVNRVLGWVTSVELALGRFVRMPWGSTLVVAARRP